MPKCKKISNPCKICLGHVSTKNGLQCEGACQTWIHYECLNYTPGKINDIKSGILRVSCPCPDCKSQLPKEFRTDEPFRCSNAKCPANLPPRCSNMECPVTKKEPDPPLATGCALSKCGKKCRQNSLPLSPCNPLPLEPCAPVRYASPVSSRSESDDCKAHAPCPTRCQSSKDVPGDICRPQGLSVRSGTDLSCPLEQMCTAVGQLTGEITNLMYKMRDVLEKHPKTCRGSGRRERSQNQPCHCPGNPCNK